MLCCVLLTGCQSKNNETPETSTMYNENTELTKSAVTWGRNTGCQEDLADEVKTYILKGQADKTEDQKIKWSEAFLNKTDVYGLCKDYETAGNDTGDLEKAAEYVTENAKVLDNWQDLFKEDIKNNYNVEITKIDSLEGDLYKAYIISDGNEVPYVTVNSKTGYYHQ